MPWSALPTIMRPETPQSTQVPGQVRRQLHSSRAPLLPGQRQMVRLLLRQRRRRWTQRRVGALRWQLMQQGMQEQRQAQQEQMARATLQRCQSSVLRQQQLTRGTPRCLIPLPRQSLSRLTVEPAGQRTQWWPTEWLRQPQSLMLLLMPARLLLLLLMQQTEELQLLHRKPPLHGNQPGQTHRARRMLKQKQVQQTLPPQEGAERAAKMMTMTTTTTSLCQH